MGILIRNVRICEFDTLTKLKTATIAVEGDKIVFAGDESHLPPQFKQSQTIDGKGKIAIPGLINTHTHSAMMLFRGLHNDLPLNDWLASIWPLEDLLTEDDAYWLSSMAIAEMISEGITTFADMYMFMDKTALAVKESGVRAVLARGLQGADYKSEFRLKDARKLHSDWHDQAEGRIKVAIGPHAIYTCERDYLIRCIELAHELDAMINIHLAETEWEFDNCSDNFDKTPVAYLDDLGMFEIPTLAAHCVHVSDEDIDILSDKNVSVAHCPSSNLKLASGIAPLDAMLKMGVNVSLGTDSAASNNSLSIIKEMNIASLIHKGNQMDATAVTAKQCLLMATKNGAAALGLNDIGSISEGMKADIALIDAQNSRYFPQNDPNVSLVYAGMGSDVETVIVNGKMIMEKREIKTLDVERIKYEANKISKRILNI